MKPEIYHPFEVAIFPGLTGPESLYFAVNSGKVFNFYNPLNYRNVTCNRDGPDLPKLPFKLTRSSSSIQIETSPLIFPIENSWTKIYIYLFCSFLPPINWVPGPSFIPFLDKAWIVYKNNTGTIIGETKNKEVSHIKYQTYKNKDTSDNGNAINYSPIASIEKIDNEWIVNQFLTDNLPITTLFDSSSFELHNTSKYNLADDDVVVPEGDGYTLRLLKKEISEVFRTPTSNILKGYIRADAKDPNPILVPESTIEIDTTSRLGFENITSLNTIITPISETTPETEKPITTGTPYPIPTGFTKYS